MSTAEDRKRAKQEYMAALAAQRQPLNRDGGKVNSQDFVDSSNRDDKMSAREKILEERRQKFLAKKSQPKTDTEPKQPKNAFAEMFDATDHISETPRHQDEAQARRVVKTKVPSPIQVTEYRENRSVTQQQRDPSIAPSQVDKVIKKEHTDPFHS